MVQAFGSDVTYTHVKIQSAPRRRRLLLLGTALGSTLVALSASPSFAANCTQPPSPAPITVTGAATPISCTNTDARTATVAGDNAIDIVTTGDGNTVDITNSGTLTTEPGSLIPGPSYSLSTGARGIFAGTNGIGADITINNSGTINSFSDSIKATDAATSGTVFSNDTHITITNAGDLTAGPNAEGIFGRASYGSGNVVTIDNSGSIQTGYSTSTSGTSTGIVGNVGGDNGLVDITNSGAITTTGLSAAGISAVASYYNGSDSSIVIDNKAGGTINTTHGAYGIFAQAGSISPSNSLPNPDNGGTIQLSNAATINSGYIGVGAFTYGSGGDITIQNSGAITSGNGGDDGSDGIKAVANGSDSTLSVTNSGNIDTTAGGANSIGIEAINGPLFTGSNLQISVKNTGDITTGADSEGIFARSGGTGSTVTVDNSGNIQTGSSASLTGSSSGIFADVDGDNTLASVTNSGTIDTIGASAAGISAIANFYNGNGGSVIVDNKAGGTITTTGAGAYGIFAQAGKSGGNADNDGTVQITNAATVSAGYMGVAGFTYGTGGNITIDNSGNITSGTGGAAKSTGIKALIGSLAGDGTITVTNTGNVDTSAGGERSVGIQATGGNAITSADVHISVTNSGDIKTAINSVGIFANAGGNYASATVDNSGAIETGASSSTSGGSTGIFADVDGNNSLVDITNNGAIRTTGLTAAGISAIANYYNGSNGDITINNKAGGTIITTGAEAYGIFASSGSEDPVGTGPNANDNGTITITNAASIEAGAFGIGATAYGAGSTVTVTNNGNVYGTTGGILVSSVAGSTVNVGTSGYVGAENFLAIKSTAGSVEINNDGIITGRVELSDAGNVMNIGANGLFETITNSTFGAGNDTLNNEGVVNASGAYFGLSPNTVTLSGLENFVNGSYGSGPGLTTMIDGVVGDSLTTSGNFTGQGNSRLGVDADFSTNTSDKLTIGGNSYGHTNLVVNVTAIAPGVPTTTFIPVVTVNGVTSDSNFDVAAPVNAGLFAYDLFLQGNQHGLRYVGLGNAAYELPAGITGAQDVWQDTTGFWQDRMADLRTQASGTHNADMPEENLTTRMGGIWARAMGDWSNRDSDVSYTDPVSLQTETLNLDRKQRTGAFLGGVDMGIGGVAGGDLLFGVMGGYVTSKLDFKATDDTWDYRGGTVGAYATYLSGGFYLDGLVKADFLNVDIHDSQGAIGDSASTNATNIGVRLDTGYRVAMGWGFIEPQASLEWVHTDMDSVSLFGGDISFDNSSSGRARIGVRVGTDMQMNGMTVSPDLTLSVWNHFGGDNAVNIDFPGNAFSATDSAGNGTFGEVGVGVNVASSSNWSGLVRGSVRFGDNYSAGSISAALRYGW